MSFLTGAVAQLYRYARRSLPGPGAENRAYLDQPLPYQTPIGPGQSNRRAWYQYPGGVVPQFVTLSPVTPGLPDGQFYGTPLTAPPTPTVSDT